MTFLKAVLAWAAIGFVLGLGLFQFALWLTIPGKGSPWLFILAVLGFIISVGRVCAKSH